MALALTVLIAALGLSLAMACAWKVQRVTGNSGWIDACWTFSAGAAACFLALAPSEGGEAPQPRQWLAAAFAACWSLRLGWHIVQRTRKTDDDPRYRDMIRQWGDKGPVKLFWHLQSQAMVGLLLAVCVMLAARNPAPLLGPLDVAAILVFATGLAGEAIADAQLRRFRLSASPGSICDSGLWRWSRHPNYFFEWLCWLAYPLLAIAPGGKQPIGYLALLAPLCMYWLLTRVSGLPPLEAHMLRTRGAAFTAYRQSTSAFFPFPPRG